MLHVRTFLQPSEIHGTGVFAAQEIAAGETVWQFDPMQDLVVPRQHGLGVQAATYMQRFSYFDVGRGGLVLCGDNAKWMNHSATPNTAPVFEESQGLVYERDIAARDIRAGEEITCDYRVFDRAAGGR